LGIIWSAKIWAVLPLAVASNNPGNRNYFPSFLPSNASPIVLLMFTYWKHKTLMCNLHSWIGIAEKLGFSFPLAAVVGLSHLQPIGIFFFSPILCSCFTFSQL